MNTYEMTLRMDPFQKIWDGEKTIELRLWDEKRQVLQVGDRITFTRLPDEKRKITVQILKMHRFESFADLYAALPLEKCGYAPGEKADPRDMLAYYPAQVQKNYGVVGIEFTVLQRNEVTE